MLLLSHVSPKSINPLPHFGFSAHPVVLSWHIVGMHPKVPPMNVLLKSVHDFICPNTLPSHDSPVFIRPSPQVPTEMPLHPDVSILQPMQERVPSVNVEGL